MRGVAGAGAAFWVGGRFLVTMGFFLPISVPEQCEKLGKKAVGREGK